MPWSSDGATNGTRGESKRLEAIEIKLTGDIAKYYDVYYRVYVQNFGWMGWAKNGAPAGSEGKAKRLEAIEIKLIRKSETGPTSSRLAYFNSDTYYSALEQLLCSKTYTGVGNDVVNYAKKALGASYLWDGTDFKTGIDCSGLTMKTYEHFGYTLPHFAYLLIYIEPVGEMR
jgi:uncharacterized protein YjdB